MCFQNEAFFAILPVSILTSSCLYYHHGYIRCNDLHTSIAALEAAVATGFSVHVTGEETRGAWSTYTIFQVLS